MHARNRHALGRFHCLIHARLPTAVLPCQSASLPPIAPGTRFVAVVAAIVTDRRLWIGDRVILTRTLARGCGGGRLVLFNDAMGSQTVVDCCLFIGVSLLVYRMARKSVRF